MRYYLLLICWAGLSSCFHVYYAPNTPNTPLFKEKNETRVNATYSAGYESEFEGGELQIATAVHRNIGLIASFMSVARTDEVSNSNGNGSYDGKGKGSYGELGAGYFEPIDKTGNWLAEIYGGIGFGTATNTFAAMETSKVGMFKVFAQPAIGYRSENFEFGFVPRIAYVKWTVKQNNLSDQNNSSDLADMKIIQSKPSFFSFEPAVVARGGSDALKVQFSLASCSMPGSSARKKELVESLTMSLGISLNIKPSKKSL